jgi:hypothetical protein
MTIDPHYPIFVLVFCILKKADYIGILTPRLQSLKMKHFGHDAVILHEHALRKGTEDFSFLNSSDKKEHFMTELTQIIGEVTFHLGCVVIRKNELKENENPENPYHLALEAGLIQVDSFLSNEGVVGQKTHLLFEKRGKNEDGELKSEFRRLCEKNRDEGRGYPFDVVFVDKKANHLGLQLADLLARPIGLSILRPDQPIRTYEVMEKKLLPHLLEKQDGRDLRCFP